jgi:hypothetical protein
MGRKRKSGLDVCPFDVNMLSDVRMRRLIRLHQGDAIAVYMAALCLIYRDGYYVEYDDDSRFKLSEQTGVSEATVDAVIADAVACGLFDSDVFASARVLTSQEIQDTYVAECAKTKRKVEIKPIIISSEEMPIYSEEISINSEEIAINSEEMPVNSAFTPKNSEEMEVSSEEMTSTEILPVPVAHTPKVITPVIDVVEDNDSTLELFNTTESSNNIYQEKEKTKQKEKEAGLALPYCSAEFVGTWEILRKQPKWKKKTKSALQMSLNKLGKYPEEFAILLMENAIAGGWQGVVFTWTPDDFRRWEASRSGSPKTFGNKKPKDIYESNMESMSEAFRLIDEKYGT